MESIKKVDIEVLGGEYNNLDRTLTWTGSSYDKSELIENENGYFFIDTKD